MSLSLVTTAVGYVCPISTKLKFRRHVSVKVYTRTNCTKIRVGLCERTDGQADMTKLIVPFRNFANAPKTKYFSVVMYIFNEFNSLKIIPILTYPKESNLVN